METEKIEIQRIKRGRPKIIENFNRNNCNKLYYENNKEKFSGDYHCKTCNVICSKSNKSYHNKSKMHLRILELTNSGEPITDNEYIKTLLCTPGAVIIKIPLKEII